MKYGKYLVGGIALAMLAATPAYAQEGGSDLKYAVTAELGYGNRQAEAEEANEWGTSVFSADLSGAILWRGFSGQIDYVYEDFSTDGEGLADDDDLPKTNSAAGVHLSYRDPSLFLVGAFYGYGWTDMAVTTPAYEVSFYGIEGQYYTDNITLYAQIGWGDNEAGDDTEEEGFVDGTFYRAAVRWFPNDNMSFQASLGYGETDSYIDGFPGVSPDAGEFRDWGMKWQMRLQDSLPLYITAGYRGSHFDATTEDDMAQEQVFGLGLKIVFGPSSLKDNDRNGANLDLPMFIVRGNGFAEVID